MLQVGCEILPISNDTYDLAYLDSNSLGRKCPCRQQKQKTICKAISKLQILVAIYKYVSVESNMLRKQKASKKKKKKAKIFIL